MHLDGTGARLELRGPGGERAQLRLSDLRRVRVEGPGDGWIVNDISCHAPARGPAPRACDGGLRPDLSLAALLAGDAAAAGAFRAANRDAWLVQLDPSHGGPRAFVAGAARFARG
ncbi:hypothetical protein ACQ5SO_11715 [Rhodovulum sp. DZ06]|uniref:hypothetical protein n=1 Tax=Rhodovulum sp. DZ06 TaxID=3425126 RepID=UPI003D328B11